MLGADRPVYATPLENLRAAQAAVDELNGLGADELPYMNRRIQQLIDAAAERQKPAPTLRVLPHTESTPRSPGRRPRAAPAQEKTRSRLLAAAGLGSPLSATQKAAPERWNDKAIHLPPPPRGERYPTPPPVTHPTLGGRLGHREGVDENDARHRIDRLARS